MVNLNNLLIVSAPSGLSKFLSSCATETDLISKLEQDRSHLFSMLQDMKVEGNGALSASLFSRVKFSDLDNPEIKRFETVLRNCGMLKGICVPDFSLKEEGVTVATGHRSILVLESPYFQAMKEFKEFQEHELVMKETGISSSVYQLVIDYLYLSDKDRKEYLSTVDKTLLVEIARLADYWKIEELKELCDEELCICLNDFRIEKSDVKDWLARSYLFPKFSFFLGFINRVAGDSDLGPIIEEMGSSKGAAKLANKCTPGEVALFAQLKTEFGKACCQLTLNAFGKEEWEKAFPITIVEVPPLPPNIYEILDQKDPYDPRKKMKETCVLFLRPQKVILHEETGDKEFMLGFNEVEELAKKMKDPNRRARYDVTVELRNLMKGVPVESSAWVLMRKQMIPGSRNKSFQAQEQLLKGCFEVPKIMDAILLNIIIYASEGKCLYGRRPLTHTRCQEKFNTFQITVGGFGYQFGFETFSLCTDYFDNGSIGLSATWKL